MDRADRARLRDTLRSTYRWLDETEWGPRAVPAGECDRCELAPRLVPTCGPSAPRALCRDCALALGRSAWCEGHADDGELILNAVAALPDEWRTVSVVWWIATGEVRVDSLVATEIERLPSQVRASLPGPNG